MEVLITVKTRKLQYHEESKQIPATAVYREKYPGGEVWVGEEPLG